MIIIIFAVFAVICLVFIAYLLNRVWELDKYNDDLQSKLAFAGKNYIEMRNKLNEEITLLKTKINKYESEKCKKQRKPIRKSSNKGSKRKVRL